MEGEEKKGRGSEEEEEREATDINELCEPQGPWPVEQMWIERRYAARDDWKLKAIIL